MKKIVGKMQRAKERGVAKILALMLIFSNFAFAAKSLDSILNEIYTFLESGTMKLLVGIVIVILGIYTVRNWDRWKEISMLVITIITGIVVIMNARSIGGIFF